MDSGLSGPRVTPLGQTTGCDLSEVSAFITNVLRLINKQDAYGILVGVNKYGGPIVPTFIFGIPEYDNREIVIPATPHNLPVLMRNDRVMAMNDLESPWAMETVIDLAQLTLKQCSVGIESRVTLANMDFLFDELFF